MTEKQYSPSAREKKISKVNVPVQPKNKEIKKEKKEEIKKETIETEKKAEEANVPMKKKKEERVAKEFAVANGVSLRISPKYAGEVCRMIKGMTPEAAILRMQQVLKMKRAVPMQRRETAHQKGKGISGGKFPVMVCEAIIDLVKQADANANYNGVENPVIFKAIANKASQPFRSGGRRGKRAHVYIELRDRTKINKEKK
ncbi:MAG: uL22 family ribosomal protein [Candidatus Pacearchaeota archaeon]